MHIEMNKFGHESSSLSPNQRAQSPKANRIPFRPEQAEGGVGGIAVKLLQINYLHII
jgi:hypothetical protein